MASSSPAAVRASAEELFKSQMYCAESVVLAIARAEGVESDLLPKAATAFCSGMARTCGPCGALTGAVMGVGLVLGRSGPDESVQPAYLATRKVIERFESRFGSANCQALLGGCDLNTPEGQAMFRDRQLGKRCLDYTGSAAEIAAQAIAESK